MTAVGLRGIWLERQRVLDRGPRINRMYPRLLMQFDASISRAQLDSAYFNAGTAGVQKRPWKAHLKELRMTGELVAFAGDGSQYSMAIQYTGRGSMKDVFSLKWRKVGGSVVPAVMKVMDNSCHGHLEEAVTAVRHERMTRMMPEQYGLYGDVEVYILHAGAIGRRQTGRTVSLQLEANHGDDMAVAFQKLLDQGPDHIPRALDLWLGAVEFVAEWQFREGGGRQGRRYHFLLDFHAKNMCNLAWVRSHN